MKNDNFISTSQVPTQDEIALRAHQLWIQHGCPHGHDVDNWLEAERQLLSEYGNRTASIPRTEDVIHDSDDHLDEGGSIYSSLKDEAPLATKVEEQLINPGRAYSRNSKTSLEPDTP